VTVRKKVTRAAKQDLPDVRQKRAAFRTRAARVDPRRLMFVDESGQNTAMARMYGRGPVGERVVGTVPAAHWQTTTIVSANRADGLAAPQVFAGATDAAAYLTYVSDVLVPAMRPGDIVVLDNLAAHRVPAVARRLLQAGAGVWHLPPNTPDINPIELIWAKVNAWLRRRRPRLCGQSSARRWPMCCRRTVGAASQLAATMLHPFVKSASSRGDQACGCLRAHHLT
jgi:transposase